MDKEILNKHLIQQKLGTYNITRAVDEPLLNESIFTYDKIKYVVSQLRFDNSEIINTKMKNDLLCKIDGIVGMKPRQSFSKYVEPFIEFQQPKRVYELIMGYKNTKK